MEETRGVRNVTTDEFEALIQRNDLIFVDFWASWCAPCKQFSSVYEKVATQFPQVIFVKVDIEKEQDLAETFHIRSIPHLMVFKQGIVIYSEAGSMPESTLTELVLQGLAADVSEIREQINKNDIV